jgi:carboxylate-amine ligase
MTVDFAASKRSTLGVEWELALVDVDSGEMRQAGPAIIEALATDGTPHPHVHPEFLRNTVEMVTGVADTVHEAMDDFREAAAQIRSITDPMRVDFMCAGTHPFTRWTTQKVTNNPRYHVVVDRAQEWGRQLLIYGVHCHVGVESRDKVLPIMRGLATFVPHLQALSASSPFYDGRDTGYASMRAMLFQQLPTAGLPYQFEEWSELERYVSDMTRTGVLDKFQDVRWDIRPAPHYGTVEIRVCDGVSNLAEMSALVALMHCLVEYLSTLIDQGKPVPTMPPWFVSENKWRAARYGLDAIIILDDAGNEEPVTDAIRRLVDDLAPIADRLGCSEELRGVLDILDIGASYQRQRAVYANALAQGDSSREAMEAVIAHLCDEMRADHPLPVSALPTA